MASIDDGSDEDRQGEIRLGPLEDYIAFHLRLAQGASFRAFQRTAGVPGLRPGLVRGADADPREPRDHADGAQPGERPRQVDDHADPAGRSSARGSSAREAVPGDRRSYALRLTAEGDGSGSRTSASGAAEHDRRLDAIVGDRKQELLALLRRIVAELGEEG